MRQLKWQRGFVIALLFFTGMAFAGAQSPVAMMRGVASRMVSSLEKNQSRLRGNSNLVYSIVKRVLIPNIDLTYMAKRVVGRRYWSSASSTQKTQFKNQFMRMVTSTYAAALASFDGDKVIVYPMRGGYAGRNRVIVNSVIVRKTGQRIPVVYNLIRRGNTWKVYDFSIENISMVQSYNAQFRGVLARYGMSGLITRLYAHNRRKR